jgi:hypothetical protein
LSPRRRIAAGRRAVARHGDAGGFGKQKDRARLVFERSAEQAGFFEQGNQRLVMQGVGYQPEAPRENGSEKPEPENGGGQEPPSSELHPFIQGLIHTLPEPEDDWPVAGRVKWLQTAANIFDLIYKGDGGIKIEMAMAQRSPRPSE